VRLNGGKFGNFQRSAWRRLVTAPSTAGDNGAGLSKTRERGKLENDPAAIWGMSVEANESSGSMK
jgi:hypothetical protein